MFGLILEFATRLFKNADLSLDFQPTFILREAISIVASRHEHGGRPMSTVIETADVVVIGSGPGGAIPAYRLAAAGAKVVVLERGPWLATEEFTHDLQIAQQAGARQRGAGGGRARPQRCLHPGFRLQAKGAGLARQPAHAS